MDERVLVGSGSIVVFLFSEITKAWKVGSGSRKTKQYGTEPEHRKTGNPSALQAILAILLTIQLKVKTLQERMLNDAMMNKSVSKMDMF